LKNHKRVHIPPTKKDKTSTWRCRICIWKNIKKEMRFVCEHCSIPLHLEGCYTRYHTLKHYWRCAQNFIFLSLIVFS
jgi:hypothetical protein